jgi:hypothetical protein
VAKAALSPLNSKNHQNGTKKRARRAQAYGFSKFDSEKSFSENFTWVEAVRKNPPAELFIFGPYFPPMVLYAPS